MVTLFILFFYTASIHAEERPAEKWQEYFFNEQYHAYYNRESITSFLSNGDTMARIWSGEVEKEVVKKKAWKDLKKNIAVWEYNCTKKTVALIRFLSEGMVEGGDSSLVIAPSHIEIAAGSQYERLYRIACNNAGEGKQEQ